ncbi:hypothetical protein [Paracoccus sp. KR1-242]|uniref:hypothetical protein n=1 Tax=Paracoccus sp. KR1-242 TaxID=3410028 RepID=UPI003C08B9B3
MTTVTMNRADLKAVCLTMLEAAAIEHPAGHQGKLAARYIIRTTSGERVGLMFEKGERTKPYVWVERRFARDLLDLDIEFRLSLASSLYQEAETGGKRTYGRHAALKSMRDLANADLIRFTIDRPEQMGMILQTLMAI